MSTKRDKTTGLPLPSPVDPGEMVCVQMIIPNAPEYRQALRGVISELGKYWTWSQTQGQSSAPALEAAELWRYAATTITYSENCGDGPMSCSDVTNCIDSDPGTRAAISGLASQAAQPGSTAVPGQPLSPTAWAGNLTPTDDCSFNAFWAQCEQFVNWVVTAGIDTIESLEAWSNAIEAGQFIEMIPFIGTLVDEAQIDKAIQFVDWVLETVSEAFLAADTQPNRQEIACALFCAMRADCELSLEESWEVINGRLGGVLDPSSLNSLDDLIDAAIVLVNNPAVPLDVWLIIILSLGKVMSYLGVQGLNQSLNIVLKLAVNDANNDWELLCEDCPPPSEGPWIILPDADNPFSSGQPLGTITSQTSTTVIAEASLGGDGVYRLALKRTDHCGTTTALVWDPSAPTGSTGCAGYVGGVLPDAPGAFYDRFYTEKATPYGVELGYSA